MTRNMIGGMGPPHAMPHGLFRPSDVVWPPPSAYLLMSPENLFSQDNEAFRETERYHQHNFSFGG
jgi:hypothetical protein